MMTEIFLLGLYVIFQISGLIEKQLAESEEKLSAVFETAVDGIILIDKAGTIEMANASVSSMFGYEAHEVIGQNVKMLMPSPYHSEHDGYLDNYHKTGKRKVIGIGREVKGRKKDGTTFPLYLTVSEVNYLDRKVYAGFVRDISAIRYVEEQLVQSQQVLRSVFETAVDGIIIINRRGLIPNG